MKSVYVLGSGFSAQAGAPLSKTVLPEIFSAAQSDPKIKELKTFLDDFLFKHETNWVQSTSLEEILSRLDLIRSYQPYANIDYGQVSYFEDLLLQEFIALLFPEKLNSRKPSYQKFAARLNTGSTIITFNYDLLVENILREDGKNYDYCYFGLPFADSIRLLKLHGSVNTCYCPDCGSVETLPVYRSKTLCKSCRTLGKKVPLKSFVIAPTRFKSYGIPVLRQIWFVALQTLAAAKQIFFLGYSLPEADLLSYQLFDFAQKMGPHRQRVELVNGPGANPEKFSQIYGENLINSGLYFEEWVALP